MAWQTPKTNWTSADGVADADFNRIEENILELYRRATETTDVTIYVNPNGSDVTGSGTSAAPFRTISHAVSMAQKTTNANRVVIRLASGTYDEAVVISGFNDTSILITGSYNSDASLRSLTVNNSVVKVDVIRLSFTAGGITADNGSTVLISGRTVVSGSERGIYAIRGSTVSINSTFEVSNATTAMIHAAQASTVYVVQLHSSTSSGGLNAVAIISEQGSTVSYGTYTANASVDFTTRTGGRIYTGSQV